MVTKYVGQLVTFTDNSNDPSITLYSWNFGDGATGTGNPVTHIYSSPSTYTVTHSTTNNCGTTWCPSQQITILSTATPTPTPTPVPGGVCSWITSVGGWNNLNWANNVLTAYYVYIGTPGYSVGYSPVTWVSVLGLYYYYIGNKANGNSQTGCSF